VKLRKHLDEGRTLMTFAELSFGIAVALAAVLLVNSSAAPPRSARREPPPIVCSLPRDYRNIEAVVGTYGLADAKRKGAREGHTVVSVTIQGLQERTPEN
jgi:hypothetical protein